MKLIKNFIVIASMMLLFAGCVDDDFDVPPINIPRVDFDANTTIAELKAMYSGGLDSIDTNIIITGVVVANDESGNFYKQLEIQDHTGGIEVRVDRYDLYTQYKVGQRVYIKCKGLFLGNYGGLVQIGYKYQGAIGRIPDAIVDQHIFRDSLPGTPPAPIKTTIPGLNSGYLSMLIQIDSVHFAEVGSRFAEANAITNRTILDRNGHTLTLRTSNYANFASELLPAGEGSIRGILSIYNGTYQLYIRDLNDLVNWNENASLPFLETFSSNPLTNNTWLTYSAASNRNWTYSSTNGNPGGCMEINGYGADVASDDWLISPEFNLTSDTAASLKFDSWTQYIDAGFPQPMRIYILENYSTGDPLATATDISSRCAMPAANSKVWTSSGTVNISDFVGKTVRIAFRYRSSSTGASTSTLWRIDNVAIDF